MRTSRDQLSKIEAAAKLAAELERTLSRALHRHLSSLSGPDKALLKASLAEALETTAGTICRQSRRDLPMQSRLMAAASLLDHELYRKLRDVEAGVMGLRWYEPPTGTESHEDLRQMVADGLEHSARVASMTLQALADKRITVDELETLRPEIHEAERQLQKLDDAVEQRAREDNPWSIVSRRAG